MAVKTVEQMGRSSATLADSREAPIVESIIAKFKRVEPLNMSEIWS